VAAWDIPDIVAEWRRPEAAAVRVSARIRPGAIAARHFDGHFLPATEGWEREGANVRTMDRRERTSELHVTFGCAKPARLFGWYP
jgi:hypothetical protein